MTILAAVADPDTEPDPAEVLHAEHMRVLGKIAELSQEVAKLQRHDARVVRAIVALGGEAARPMGTGEVIRAYLCGLEPGDIVDVDGLMTFAYEHLWTTSAISQRGAMLSRLARLAEAGVLNRTDRGEYRKVD